MHNEGLSGIEIRQQVFRPAGKPSHGTTAQPLGKVRWKGDPQVAPTRLRPGDPAVFQHGRKAFPHGFNFGQFRHSGIRTKGHEGG
jgi:hypothetical protein